jgi:hypothetical protein
VGLRSLDLSGLRTPHVVYDLISDHPG